MTITRQVPLIVTITREHIVWVDVEHDDDEDSVIAGWKEEPYDLFKGLTDENADNLDWTVEHEPTDTLLHNQWVGPYFASGAFTSDEEERLQDHLRRTEQRRATFAQQSPTPAEEPRT